MNTAQDPRANPIDSSETSGSMDVFQCPRCKTAIQTKVGQTVTCEKCRAEFRIPEFAPRSKIDVIVGLRCASCGAEMLVGSIQKPVVCPFCGSSSLDEKRHEGIARPDYVVPFKLTESEAIEAFASHYRFGRYLPKDLDPHSSIVYVQDAYMPYWVIDGIVLFDSIVLYSETHWVNIGKYAYAKKVPYFYQRAGSFNFYGVPINGSRHLPDYLGDSLNPFHRETAVGYEAELLQEHPAVMWDDVCGAIPSRVFDRAHHTFEQKIEDSIDNKSNLSSVTIREKHSTERIEIAKLELALFPVWNIVFDYEGRWYPACVNAQTGEVCALLPIDEKASQTHARIVSVSISLFESALLPAVFLPLYVWCSLSSGEINPSVSIFCLIIWVVVFACGVTSVDASERTLRRKINPSEESHDVDEYSDQQLSLKTSRNIGFFEAIKKRY